MKIVMIFAIGFIGIVLIATSNFFSNEVYGSNKSEKFVQQNNFTVIKMKDNNLIEIDGWSSSGFVGNVTMSVILEFENGSKVNYNNVKALGMEYGRGYIENNDMIGPDKFADEIGNGFVQNNNITLTQNNDLIGADEVGNGFVQKNIVRGGWTSSG